MIRNYNLNYPGEIIFGAGTAEQLKTILAPYPKIMLVTGKSAAANGTLARLEKLLAGHERISICGIASEPPLTEVNRVIDAGRHHGVKAVVAVGGGSVLDTAKTAACLIPAEGRVEDYFDGKRKISAPGLFCAALPTTSGTGAEITPNAVFIDQRTRNKKSLRHRYLVPGTAIVDPELTLSAPPEVTAASGLDALTQAIESYVSLNACNASMALAEKAITLITGSLENAYRNGSYLPARIDMAEGSLLTAMAFSQSGLGAVHGIGHPLGSLLHLAHGTTCAILLPHVLRWNLPAAEDQLHYLAHRHGMQSANDFIDYVAALCRRLQIPENFRAAGLMPEHFDFIVENCRSGSMKCNPRPMSDDEVRAFLGKLC